MLADIRDDLAEFGVTFDRWYSEQDAWRRPRRRADRPRARSACAPAATSSSRTARPGSAPRCSATRRTAWWCAPTARRPTSPPTSPITSTSASAASSCCVTILGADHHGYVARVRAGLAAMGEPPDSLEVPMVQFVTLWKGGEKVAMGKREAQFVTLRDLRAEVGNDAARFIYVMRSHDQALDFDLELATQADQRQPGLLRAVRARAHRERAEAGRRARPAVRPRGRARGARVARGAGRDRADARGFALARGRAPGR